MVSGTTELIETGLRAWAGGDLDALEAVLDPKVSLRWFEAGKWDCTGREQVMELLRQRQSHGLRPHSMRIDRLDASTFVVSPASHGNRNQSKAFSAATRITVTDGSVSEMQQYRSRADAMRKPLRGRSFRQEVFESVALVCRTVNSCYKS
jgi:ketosteroid isomerase-like protein